MISFYDDHSAPDADSSHGRERLKKATLADAVAMLKAEYPDQAKDLPDADSLPNGDSQDDNSDDALDDVIELLGHFQLRNTNKRPPGEFQTAEQLEKARLRSDPFTATFRMVYELIADDADRRDFTGEPVLAVEVVTLSFEFHGEKWEQVVATEGGGGDATDANRAATQP